MASCSKDKKDNIVYKGNFGNLSALDDSHPAETFYSKIYFDKDDHVTKIFTTNTYFYENSDLSKEEIQNYISNVTSKYKNKSGVTSKIIYSNNKATHKLKIIVKDVSKKDLPILFKNSLNADYTVSFQKYTKNIDKRIYKKYKNAMNVSADY